MRERLRFMRVMVYFDLPTLSDADRRGYRQFIKFLKKNGYIMQQESVYMKICASEGVVPFVIEELKKNNPNRGQVEVLTITEKQFANREIICGHDSNSSYINTTDSVVFL